jgi:hypothetical protein
MKRRNEFPEQTNSSEYGLRSPFLTLENRKRVKYNHEEEPIDSPESTPVKKRRQKEETEEKIIISNSELSDTSSQSDCKAQENYGIDDQNEDFCFICKGTFFM